jgi:heat shock protein HslJ
MKSTRTATMVVLGSVLLASCQSRTGAPQASADAVAVDAPVGAPTLEELRRATYHGLEDLDGPVTLAEGGWEGEPFAPGAASRPTVSLAPGFRVTGDLDGDGADEAVVVLAQSSGGSGTFNSLAVVQRTAGGLENVATTALGDRVDIRSARIEGGTLLVSVVRAGEGDAMCCPGELAELGWTLSGSTLEPVAGSGPTGRLSPDTLAGTEWVLRAWDVDDAAPADPEVTLAYADGRLAGTSGCNRYFAPVTAGELPGDLSLGPAAGTMMACPEPQGAVEQRFLKQLAAARKFGFWLGQLQVTYEKDDGAIGMMLFERRPAGDAGAATP